MQIEAAATAELATPVDALIAPIGERVGCGWFDSSYELNEGLVVTEDFDPCVFALWLAAAPTVH